MEHLTVQANGAAFHVARMGAGRPLLLLHGWPEFWLTWEPVMTRLADRFTLYAPDLRGFGDSDKPDGLFGPDQQAADMLALMDALGLDAGRHRRPRRRRRADAAAGAAGAASASPDYSSSISSIPASGRGWRSRSGSTTSGTSPSTRWRWRLPSSARRRESCRRYIGHFLKAWSHRKDAFDDRARSLHRQFPQSRTTSPAALRITARPMRAGSG